MHHQTAAIPFTAMAATAEPTGAQRPFSSLTAAQKNILRQVCLNKNSVKDGATATILSPAEIRSAKKLAEVGLLKLDGHLAYPTYKALVWFPQWNPDQLMLF